ncbi:hypothetical protein NPIL_598071 [Nephila pilipes]|uniref:Uncharacterized protein n=1 Tax=Nephila pilipes TaxID=299642 RepID=A0A8X6PGM6_NEPPI|nr:hypothetical protein NPIL_598071 [Nephila pilipes]
MPSKVQRHLTATQVYYSTWRDAEIRLRIGPRPVGRPKGLSDDVSGECRVWVGLTRRSPSRGECRVWVGPTGGGGSPALSVTHPGTRCGRLKTAGWPAAIKAPAEDVRGPFHSTRGPKTAGRSL